jgi:hypothetical protein
VFERHADISWLQRPVQYATPGVELPVQPSVMLLLEGAPFVAATFEYQRLAKLGRPLYPLSCYATLIQSAAGGHQFVLSGTVKVRMVQSVCTFSDLSIDVANVARNTTSPDGGYVGLRVCANTSATLYPHIRIHPCNMTMLSVATCPKGTLSNLFNISDSVQTLLFPRNATEDWLASLSAEDSARYEYRTIASGYHYPWALRHRTLCVIRGRNALASAMSSSASAIISPILASTRARWLHGCAVECVFDARTIFTNLFRTSATRGFMGSLSIAFDSAVDANIGYATRDAEGGASSCPGSPLYLSASTTSSQIGFDWFSPCSARAGLGPIAAVGCPLVLRGRASDFPVFAPGSNTLAMTDVVNGTAVFTSSNSTTHAYRQPLTLQFCSDAGTRATYASLFDDVTQQTLLDGGDGNATASVLVAKLRLGLPNGTIAVNSNADGSVATITNFSFADVSTSRFTLSAPNVGFNVTPACSTAAVPLLFEPREAFGWSSNGTEGNLGVFTVTSVENLYCVAVSRSEIVDLVIATDTSAEDFPCTADTITPYRGSITIEAFDGLGANISNLSQPINAHIEFLSAMRDTDGVTTLSIVPTAMPVTISAFPVVLDSIVFPVAGAAMSFQLTISAADNPHLGGRIATEGAVRVTLFGEAFPVQRNISVSYCAPGLATQRGLRNATVSYNSTDLSLCTADGNGGSDVTLIRQIVSSRYPSRNGASTAVTVTGSLFAYTNRNQITCHYSNSTDPWSIDTVGVLGVYVSSCTVICPVPPQLFPISRASNNVLMPGGGLVPSASLPGLIGDLRIRQGPTEPWSSPLSVDVLGAATSLSVQRWAQSSYSRQFLLPLQPIVVQVVDLLGSPLVGLDPSPTPRRLHLSSQDGVLVNESGLVAADASTCAPQPGQASFDTLFLQNPSQGEYAFKIETVGLGSTEVLLRIDQAVAAFNHNLEFVSWQPLPYVDSSLGLASEGLLPIQPLVGIFRRDPDGSSVMIIDANITDVKLIATAVPLDPDEADYQPSRGIGLTSCEPDFKNCGFIEKGVAIFSGFRVPGTLGKQYNVTIRADGNDTLAITPLSFVVRVPTCDPALLATAGSTGIASQLLYPLNSTLVGPPNGVLVTGGRFPAPTSSYSMAAHLLQRVVLDPTVAPVLPLGATPLEYTCRFNTSLLPAAFIDVCHVSCFVASPGANFSFGSLANVTLCDGRGSSPGAAACCYNATSDTAQCAQPLQEMLTVALPARLFSDQVAIGESRLTAAGQFMFIGPPVAVVVAAPAIATTDTSTTINGNEMVVLAEPRTTPADVTLVLVDAAGQLVGSTDPTPQRTVRIAGAVRRHVPLRSVPANLTELTRSLGAPSPTSSCAEVWTRPDMARDTQVINVTGQTTAAMTNAVAVVSNFTINYPVAGLYDLTITVSNQVNGVPTTFAVLFHLHVLPGTPTSVCIYNDLRGVSARNDVPVSPQPEILLRDSSGNICQPLRRTNAAASTVDPNTPATSTTQETISFAALRTVNRFLATLTVSVSLLERPQHSPLNSSYAVVSNALEAEPGAVASPSLDYVERGDVTLQYFGFKQLTPVRMKYGYEYQLRFTVPQLDASAVTTFAPSSSLVSPVAGDWLEASGTSPVTNPPSIGGSNSMVMDGRLVLRDCSLYQYGVFGTADCNECPSGTTHCRGGDASTCFDCDGKTRMNVTAGFWRFSAASTIAYQCIPAEACPLSDSETGACGELYKPNSPMCSICRDGYAPNLINQCEECAAVWVNVVAIFIFAFIIAFVTWLVVFVTLKEDSLPDSDHNLVILLKIFISFIQVIAMLGEFEVNLPSFVAFYYTIVQAGSGSAGVSVSPITCLLPQWTFLDRLELQLLAPPFVIICYALLTALWGVRKRYLWRKKNRAAVADARAPDGTTVRFAATDETGDFVPESTWRRSSGTNQHNGPSKGGPPKRFASHAFVTTVTVFIYLMFQTVVSHCIEALLCRAVDTGDPLTPQVKFLQQDSRVMCAGTTYERHVAAALWGIFVYGALLPMSTMSWVLFTAGRQGWFTANEHFSFMIRGFRLRMWFWEFIIILRKVLVRLILATIQDPLLQALAGIWTMTGLFILHAYAGPYVRALHNRIEGLALLTFVVTLNVGLLFQSAGLGKHGQCNAACILVAIVLTVLNIGVLMFFAYTVLRVAYERIVELYGIDNEIGERRVSWRNVKREVYKALGMKYRLCPSFRTYTPTFQNRDLAIDLLGEEAAAEAAHWDAILHDAEYEMVELAAGGASSEALGEAGSAKADDETTVTRSTPPAVMFNDMGSFASPPSWTAQSGTPAAPPASALSTSKPVRSKSGVRRRQSGEFADTADASAVEMVPVSPSGFSAGRSVSVDDRPLDTTTTTLAAPVSLPHPAGGGAVPSAAAHEEMREEEPMSPVLPLRETDGSP